jgi:hypothetical protein
VDDNATKLALLAARADIPKDAREVIAGVIDTPLNSDVWIYRIVVIVLGMTVLITVIAGIVHIGKELPEAVLAIGSTAVGALAGLLAPAPEH